MFEGEKERKEEYHLNIQGNYHFLFRITRGMRILRVIMFNAPPAITVHTHNFNPRKSVFGSVGSVGSDPSAISRHRVKLPKLMISAKRSQLRK